MRRNFLPYENCNNRAHINEGVLDYVSQRYDLAHAPRVAIIPFDVPETFAQPGADSSMFGKELARRYQVELLSMGELRIVEVMNRDRWPGKREDFFQGNYQAIEIARNAGYDLLIVGYLAGITNDVDLELQTKLIDLSNNVTVYSARTLVTTERRSKWYGWLMFEKEKPSQFSIPERTDAVVKCSAHEMLALKEE